MNADDLKVPLLSTSVPQKISDQRTMEDPMVSMSRSFIWNMMRSQGKPATCENDEFWEQAGREETISNKKKQI